MLPISNAKKFQWDIFGDFHTVVFFRPLNGTRHSTAAAEKKFEWKNGSIYSFRNEVQYIMEWTSGVIGVWEIQFSC